MQAELETKITNLNIEVKKVNDKTKEILDNINALTGVDIDDFVHKSDLNSYLTKDHINNLSADDEKNLLLTKNDILNLPEENEELKLIIKKRCI
jgi:tmRNA-binding protein